MPVQGLESVVFIAAVPVEQAAAVLALGSLGSAMVWRALRSDIERKDANNDKAWEAVNVANEAARELIQSTEKIVALLATTTAEQRSRIDLLLVETRAARVELARVNRVLDELRGRNAAG